MQRNMPSRRRQLLLLLHKEDGAPSWTCSRFIEKQMEWGSRVGERELSLSEFTRATTAKRPQRQGNPLLVRACTSEWLRPCFYERLDLADDRERQRTML